MVSPVTVSAQVWKGSSLASMRLLPSSRRVYPPAAFGHRLVRPEPLGKVICKPAMTASLLFLGHPVPGECIEQQRSADDENHHCHNGVHESACRTLCRHACLEETVHADREPPESPIGEPKYD